MKLPVAALLLTLLSMPAQASPLPDGLLAQLRAYDTVPTAADLESVSADAPAQLLHAARDAGLDGFARARAISLLSLFPTPRTMTMLSELASEGPEQLRAVAVYTVGRSFGAVDPDAALAVVEAHLASGSIVVRDHAARALRWVARPEKVRALLASRSAVETDPLVRSLIDRTLARVPAEVQP
jgi:HEAT repeat protein